MKILLVAMKKLNRIFLFIPFVFLSANLNSLVIGQNFNGGNGDGYSYTEILAFDLSKIQDIPSVTVNQASTQSDPVNSLPIKFDVVFSKAITGFTFGDVVWSGSAIGIAGTISKINDSIYTIEVLSISTNGTVIPSIPAGSVQDGFGNFNEASTSTDHSVSYDTSRPFVAITYAAGQSSPTNSSSIDFTVFFSEKMSSFTSSNVTLSGTAGATSLSISGGPVVFNVEVSGMNNDGTVVITIADGAVADLAGNTNTASINVRNSVDYLTSSFPVSVNQYMAQADPVNSLPIEFEVIFNHSVNDFTFDDISWLGTAGSVSGNITGSGTNYTIHVTGLSSNGSVVPVIHANKVHDILGNLNNESVSTDNSVTYDDTRPTVTISYAVGQASPTNNGTINFTVGFSEDVSGFSDTKVTLSGTAGASGITISGGPMIYNVAVSGMINDGTVTINILDRVVKDLAGNSNMASTGTGNSIDYLASQFELNINQSTDQSDPVNSFPIKFDVVFSRPVIDFTFDDIAWSGTAGSVSGNINGSGLSYTIEITGASLDGTVVPEILANSIHDALGNGNLASSSTDNSVTLDRTRPSVEISLESSQQNPTNDAIISFNVVFSETVTAFGVTNVQLSGNSGASSIYIRGGPRDFIIDVSGMINPGNVIINVPENVVQDQAGNYNTASKNTANTVAFDNLKPDVTISSSESSPTSLTEIPIRIEFSKIVTGFEISDINISNATISGMTEISSGTLWEAVIVPTARGTINIQVPADAAQDEVGNSNNASNHFQIDYVPDVTKFEASNVFTPNSALNRFWTIKNVGNYTDFELIIRNSAGQLVYKTTNYQNNWNGTYKNNPLPTGTYYYSFSSQDKKIIYKGFINIIYE
jgi:gliding motility-associated-like protein